MSLPAWPLRSVAAGAAGPPRLPPPARSPGGAPAPAGPAVLSLSYAAERRLRRHHTGQLDYDDSIVPGKIVASVMHLPHVTDREDQELALALRWGYGSVFGILHGSLRRLVGEPWASAAFGATLLTATFTLFPLLGRTPPPWRWSPDVLATSIGTHVAYVAGVAAVDDTGRRRA